jgi:hypothetical protein
MNSVTIKIYKNPSKPDPSDQLPDVPWFAGMTVLQAMVIGEAMYEKSFSFRVVYRSIFGAFIDSIDDVEDDPGSQRFWMLFVNGQESSVGVSEAIISEDETITTAVIEWRYEDISGKDRQQVALKTKHLPSAN